MPIERFPPYTLKEGLPDEIGSQVKSSGPKLGQALLKFLNFVWHSAVTFFIGEASFENWQEKKALSKELAKLVSKSGAGNMKPKIEALFEKKFKLFTSDQLLHLEAALDESKNVETLLSLKPSDQMRFLLELSKTEKRNIQKDNEDRKSLYFQKLLKDLSDKKSSRAITQSDFNFIYVYIEPFIHSIKKLDPHSKKVWETLITSLLKYKDKKRAVETIDAEIVRETIKKFMPLDDSTLNALKAAIETDEIEEEFRDKIKDLIPDYEKAIRDLKKKK